MPETITRDVRVQVRSEYLDSRSNPDQGYFFFAYHVTISNEGEHRVQLLTRHWIITDANGHVEDIKGAGVVGEQPVLKPGDNFHYTSFCPLPTSFGNMRGSYQVANDKGELYDVEIPMFTLAHPHSIQ
jgi:ApaG protein